MWDISDNEIVIVTYFFYKNLVYENHLARICEILIIDSELYKASESTATKRCFEKKVASKCLVNTF